MTMSLATLRKQKGGIHSIERRPKGEGGALKLDRSYNFVDKQPIIDQLRTLVEDGGLSWREAAEKGDICETTLRNWFMGKTLRPQVPTVNKVLKIFGKKLGIVDL